MKSVGEVMAIGRTWQESLQKALRGMESGLDGWSLPKGYKRLPKDQLMYKLRVPNPDRMVIMKQVRYERLCYMLHVMCCVTAEG
jgi:carbamoyl-phosphate synthase large subunit